MKITELVLSLVSILMIITLTMSHAEEEKAYIPKDAEEIHGTLVSTERAIQGRTYYADGRIEACCSSSLAPPSPFWEQTNGPRGGRIKSIAISSEGEVYAAAEGSVFRSSDHGASWTRIGLANTFYVHSIATGPNGEIIVGTSDGVFRSTNSGSNWHDLGLNASGYDVAIKPNGHIFAATFNGVFRSVDNGATWTELPVYGNSLAITVNGDILLNKRRSTDNGDTWAEMTFPHTVGELSVNKISVMASGELVAATSQGVYLSSDNGVTWTRRAGNYTNNVKVAVMNSAGHILASMFNYATWSYGLFRHTGAGTFTEIPGGWGAREVAVLVLSGSGRFYAGTVGRGIFTSTDDGSTWTESNGTNISGDFQGIFIGTYLDTLTVNSSGHVFAGTVGGVWRSADDGETWTFVGLGDPEWVQALAIGPSNRIYAATSPSGSQMYPGLPGGVYLSTDNGATWTQRGLTEHLIDQLAVKPNGHVFALGTYLGSGGLSHGVFRSTDNGLTWTQVLSSEYINFYSLAINPNGHIFAGDSFGYVYRSTDNGNTWTTSRVSTLPPYELGINSRGHIFAGTQEGMFWSTDNGISWEPRGLTGKSIQAIAVGPNDEVYARSAITSWGSSSDDVYRSQDNGATWLRITSNLEGVSVRRLSVGSGKRVFAGTRGRGLWRSKAEEEKPIAQLIPVLEFNPDRFFLKLAWCFQRPPTPSGPWNAQCPPQPPGCPDCFGSFSKSMRTAKMKDSILRQMHLSSFWLGTNRIRTEQSVKQLLQLFGNAPLGLNFSKDSRDQLTRRLKKSLGSVSSKIFPEALRGINAFEIDTRIPQFKPRLVCGKIRSQLNVNFENAVWVTLEGLKSDGQLSLTVTDQVPALAHGYKTVWPLVAYTFGFTGKLDDRALSAITIHLPGLKQGRYGADPRLLEWDGKGYRDITYAVDPVAQTITGKKAKLLTYVIMEKVTTGHN